MVDVDEFELAPDRDLAPAPPPGPRRRARAWPWVTTAAALVLVGSVCAEPVLLTGPPGLVVGVSDVPVAAEPAYTGCSTPARVCAIATRWRSAALRSRPST